MKILGSDYDGTLTHGGIDEEKCNAIRAWRQKGHKFGIVSGRGVWFFPELFKKHPSMELDFYVACNGGVILNRDGEILFKTGCTEVSVPALAADLLAWGALRVHINGFVGERAVYLYAIDDPKNAPKQIDPSTPMHVCDLPPVDGFYQTSCVTEDDQSAKRLIERIQKAYGKHLNPLQNGKHIDIVPAGVNKAEGLLRVMEHFGAHHEDVIAVGDNVNDIDMLREFRSYAMENGVPAIRELTDGTVQNVTDLLRMEL